MHKLSPCVTSEALCRIKLQIGQFIVLAVPVLKAQWIEYLLLKNINNFKLVLLVIICFLNLFHLF